jgi:hypothetical protein
VEPCPDSCAGNLGAASGYGRDAAVARGAVARRHRPNRVSGAGIRCPEVDTARSRRPAADEARSPKLGRSERAVAQQSDEPGVQGNDHVAGLGAHRRRRDGGAGSATKTPAGVAPQPVCPSRARGGRADPSSRRSAAGTAGGAAAGEGRRRGVPRARGPRESDARWPTADGRGRTPGREGGRGGRLLGAVGVARDDHVGGLPPRHPNGRGRAIFGASGRLVKTLVAGWSFGGQPGPGRGSTGRRDGGVRTDRRG